MCQVLCQQDVKQSIGLTVADMVHKAGLCCLEVHTAGFEQNDVGSTQFERASLELYMSKTCLDTPCQGKFQQGSQKPDHHKVGCSLHLTCQVTQQGAIPQRIFQQWSCLICRQYRQTSISEPRPAQQLPALTANQLEQACLGTCSTAACRLT